MTSTSLVRRRPVGPARPLALLLLGAALLLGACGGDESPDLVFVQKVRAEFPDLSANRASDDRLLRLARSSCSPSGLSEADVEVLGQIGLDRTRFVELATPLCPAR
jgi:hypothetical protein